MDNKKLTQEQIDELDEKFAELKSRLAEFAISLALLFLNITIVWLFYCWLSPKIAQLHLPEFTWSEFVFLIILSRVLYAGITAKNNGKKLYANYLERKAKRKAEESKDNETTWL